MTAYQEIIKLLPQLPFEVLKDIERRTGDWMWSRGNEDDPYIRQQLRYGKRFVEEYGKRPLIRTQSAVHLAILTLSFNFICKCFLFKRKPKGP